MTLLRAFLYQCVIFLEVMALTSFRAWHRGDEDLSNTFPYHMRNEPTWFLTSLIMFWFVVMTYVRWQMDWPLVGIWYNIFSFFEQIILRCSN